MPCVARHMPGQRSERGLVTYSASLSYDVINDRYADLRPTVFTSQFTYPDFPALP